jgi:hypothetical protein
LRAAVAVLHAGTSRIVAAVIPLSLPRRAGIVAAVTSARIVAAEFAAIPVSRCVASAAL